MKKLIALYLLFTFTLALSLAAVENDQVQYMGGTPPAARPGAIGRLDTTDEKSLTFESAGAKLLIPYADIQSFAYSTEVTRHLGVMPAIAVGLLKMRRHSHYFRISYRGADAIPQVAVFEVSKQMPRMLQAVLQARAPQSCKPTLPVQSRTEAFK
jgi:hypothetical protein